MQKSKHPPFGFRIILILMALTFLPACGVNPFSTEETIYEIQPTYIVQKSTPDIVLITPVTLPTRPSGQYPEDAEGVVIAFLTAYQSDQEGMAQYLSQAFQKMVPDGGAGMLLQFRDILEGYAVTSAAVSKDPPAAIITVAVKVAGTADSTRVFTLAKEDGKWVITGIEIPKLED
jgi:hypothetical protein